MPRFLTIGYGDEAGYRRTSVNVRNAAHAHDEELKQHGAVMAIAGAPVQVRNPDASGVVTAPGPFATMPLPVAGFALIEAGDIEEAIRLVAQSPCAVAHGVVEVWPLIEVAD